MKKFLSVVLALIMLFSFAVTPMTAQAATVKKTSVTSVSAQPAGFKVKWKKVSGVTGYQVQYSTSSKFSAKTTKSVKVKKAASVSKTIKGLQSKKKYYVRVRAYKDKNKKSTYSAWSAKKQVTTKMASTTVRSLNAERGGFKVTWTKASGVTGYQVQYATDSKFKNARKTVTVKKASSASKTIKNLKEKKKYYVRVRTYKTSNKKNAYGAWSKSKAVTTKADTFKKGKYAGVQLNSTKDAVALYVRAYNATKAETAKYGFSESNTSEVWYAMLGEEKLGMSNIKINGVRNAMIEDMVPDMLDDMYAPSPAALPPSTNHNPLYDMDENGKSLKTSRLLESDVETVTAKDNGNGTLTLVIKPRSCQMSHPGLDAQGRFFTTLGAVDAAFDSMDGFTWAKGTTKDNVKVLYSGGTGTITIHAQTGKIISAVYDMRAHIDVKHINYAYFRDTDVSMDVQYLLSFPASDAYLKTTVGAVRI